MCVYCIMFATVTVIQMKRLSIALHNIYTVIAGGDNYAVDRSRIGRTSVVHRWHIGRTVLSDHNRNSRINHSIDARHE